MLYYPELYSDWHIRSKSFDSDKEAVDHFKKKYGNGLMAVIRDNDPHIEVVWDDDTGFA